MNCIIGQSGGPTSAINATLAGVIREALGSDAIQTVYGAFNGIEGILKGKYCNLNEIFKNSFDLDLLEATPAAALGSCRVKLPDFNADSSLYDRLFSFFEQNNIKYFFYIGGNDSMDTVAKLTAFALKFNRDVKFIGVPKTIDNDLAATDHTPGYGSAAKYIASSIQEIIRDCAVYTVKAVTIVEIMGRNAGWLTAAAALPRIINGGSSPDYVYLPECEFSMEKFFSDVEKAFLSHPNVVIAVSEGIRNSEGYIGEAGHKGKDVFGHANLSGAGKTLELALKDHFGCKVRSVEFNILQRCAAHINSKTDIDESVSIGRAAVNAALRGESGQMMCFKRLSDSPYKVEIVASDIFGIANAERNVPRNFINDNENNVTDACLAYIKPLILGETQTFFNDGLPLHFTINH